MLPIEEIKREPEPLTSEELWGDPLCTQCVCGKSITYKMVVFEFVTDRMMWVHDDSGSVECARRIAEPTSTSARLREKQTL